MPPLPNLVGTLCIRNCLMQFRPWTHLDPNARGLERGIIQRHGKDKPLGRTVFRCPHDFRQLRPLQLVGGHSRRRL